MPRINFGRVLRSHIQLPAIGQQSVISWNYLGIQG